MSTEAREPDLPSAADALEQMERLHEPLLALVRRIDDPNLPVPGLRWNAGEVCAHMISGLEIYRAMLRGQDSPHLSLGVAEITRQNDAGVASVVDRSGPGLAQRLAAGLSALHTELARPDLPTLVPWHGGMHMPPGSIGTFIVTDLSVHGHDLARALRRPWTIDPQLVDAVVRALGPVLPHLLDLDAAAGFRATFLVRLRGQGTYTLHFDNGTLRLLTGWTGPVDARVSAEPGAYLLSMFHRLGRIGPALRGDVVVYGRRPWRVLSIEKLLPLP